MRNFILGTDWWTDCDDAVAIRILARAHKNGDICLKGVGINACMEYSVKSLDAFLRSEGIEDIPDMDLIPENNVKIHTRQGVDVHFDTRACVAV